MSLPLEVFLYVSRQWLQPFVCMKHLVRAHAGRNGFYWSTPGLLCALLGLTLCITAADLFRV